MEREYPNPYGAVTAVDYSKYFNLDPPEQQIPAPQAPAPVPPAPTDGFDYNAANAQIAGQNPQTAPQAPATPKSAEEIMAGIMGELPKPEKNQATQDRLSRIMKVKALGEGLGALGDIFALSQGANVNRRGTDQSIGRYRHMYEQNEADYLRRMDDYNRELHRQKLQSLMFGVQRGDRQEDMDLRRRQMELSEAMRRDQLENDRFYKEATIEDRKEGRRIQEETQKRMEEQFKMSHGLSREQLAFNQNKAMLDYGLKAQTAENKDGFPLYDDQGKMVANINIKGGVDKLLSVILSDTDAKTEIDALKAQFGEGLSSEIKRYLVAKYWNKSKNAQEWVSGNSGMETEAKPKAAIPWNTGFSVNRPAGTPVTPIPEPKKQTSPWDQYELQ